MNHRQQLCKTIEAALHQEIRTPKDFDQLRERIFLRLHQMLSATTLKRVWGYLDNESDPSVRTLDILAQFVGYENYQAFCSQSPAEGPEPSNLAMNRHLDVMTDLAVIGEGVDYNQILTILCEIDDLELLYSIYLLDYNKKKGTPIGDQIDRVGQVFYEAA